MKQLITWLIVGSVINGCRNDRSRHVLNSFADYSADRADTTSFPVIIDGGTKIVYQFGHSTPDKGLKLYFDTISNPKGGLKLDDTVRFRLSAE